MDAIDRNKLFDAIWTEYGLVLDGKERERLWKIIRIINQQPRLEVISIESARRIAIECVRKIGD